MPHLLTLTTDFGTGDAYVAAMKGVIATTAPGVSVIDVSHAIGAQDVMEAAWILRQAVPFYPEGTVHCVVVDPGVGTDRRAIACRIAGHTFVGPDNGLLALLLGDEALGPEAPETVVVLDRPEAWRSPDPAPTFHGRDVFAPVAARLAAGAELAEVGSEVAPDSLQRLHWVRPLADEQGIRGWIAHIDRFGNAISNIPASLLETTRTGRGLRAYAGPAILTALHRTYAEVDPGEPLLLAGSSGHIEVSVRGGDAAALLSLRKGSPLQIVFSDS